MRLPWTAGEPIFRGTIRPQLTIIFPVLRRILMTSSTPEVVHSEQAPKALGPYSQGIRVGGVIYTAGQGGIDPQTGQIVEGGVEAETRQVWKNLAAVLEAAGSSLA